MPIPELDMDGYLPPGVHECTVEEVEEAFGKFRTTDQRPRLFEKLKQYLGELSRWGVAKEVVIDGSFVTKKEAPTDVDLIVVSPHDFALPAEMPPLSYNALSQRRVKKTYDFDMFFVPEQSDAYHKYVDFFMQAKEMPGRQKGIIKVRL